jgi:hypothetical protein
MIDLRNNRLIISICVFLILIFAIHWTKPRLMYNEQGGFRQFGIGYKQKTVIPIWIAAIVLAILSYLLIYYLGEP